MAASVDLHSNHPDPQAQAQPSRFRRFFHLRKYRRSRLFTPVFLLVILLCIIAIILAAVFSYASSTAKPRGSSGDFTGDATDIIVLYGRVTSVDIQGQKISMSWSVYAGTASADNSSLFTPGSYDLDADGTWYSYPDVPIDLYMNENCTASAQDHLPDGTITGYNPKIRNFGYDPLAYTDYNNSKSGVVGLGFQQTFSVDFPFDLDAQIFSRRANDLAYPFDKYLVAAQFCAVRSDTNQTFPLTMSLGGIVTNWVVTPEDFEPVTQYLVPLNNRQSLLSVERTGAAIAFACLIFFANWAITLVVIWQACLVVIWRKEFAEGLVVIPMTALFSMPAIRNVAPGSPSFGSLYDLSGFFLQIVFVALCSAFILFVVLQGREHTWVPKTDGYRFAEGGEHSGGDHKSRSSVDADEEKRAGSPSHTAVSYQLQTSTDTSTSTK